MQITLITGWVITVAALAVGGLQGGKPLLVVIWEVACGFVLKLSTEKGCGGVGGTLPLRSAKSINHF